MKDKKVSPYDSPEVDGALLLAEVEAARVDVVRDATASNVGETGAAGRPSSVDKLSLRDTLY